MLSAALIYTAIKVVVVGGIAQNVNYQRYINVSKHSRFLSWVRKVNHCVI
jgi:hypothetical protein